jgi:hypothetical protein
MTNPIYVIICGGREPYIAERDIEHSTRERTIADLAAGEWGAIGGNRFMVSSIIELETGSDKTAEFIELAKHQMDSYRTPISGEELAAIQHDRRRAIEMAE